MAKGKGLSPRIKGFHLGETRVFNGFHYKLLDVVNSMDRVKQYKKVLKGKSKIRVLKGKTMTSDLAYFIYQA